MEMVLREKTSGVDAMIKPFLRTLRLLSRRHEIIFFALVVTRVAINFLDISGLTAVGLLGALLASGLNDRPSATFIGIAIEIESSQTYFWVVVFIASFFISKTMITLLLLPMSSLFFARIEARASSEIADFLNSGSLSRLRRFFRGDTHFAVGTSPTVALNGLLTNGFSIVTEGALFVSVVAVFVFGDSTTAVIITAYFILRVLIFQLGINRRPRRLGERLGTSSIALTNSIEDMMNSFREISVCAKSRFFLNEFHTHCRR